MRCTQRMENILRTFPGADTTKKYANVRVIKEKEKEREMEMEKIEFSFRCLHYSDHYGILLIFPSHITFLRYINFNVSRIFQREIIRFFHARTQMALKGSKFENRHKETEISPVQGR